MMRFTFINIFMMPVACDCTFDQNVKFQSLLLDVAFREDESRLRNGNRQENMAALRRWSLNLIRQEKSVKGSIKTKRLKAEWDNSYLEKVLLGN